MTDKAVVRTIVPEPIKYKGRERLVGWNTAAVGHWLIARLGKSQSLGDRYTTVSEVAGFGYPRDSESNRDKVRRNTSTLRKWLGERGYFLLIQFGGVPRKIMGMKIYNPNNQEDHAVGEGQLRILEDREEITHEEAERWRRMLHLPPAQLDC